ncbi:PH domain-containing protein [Luteimonas sp. MJ250]|uniref:PH domain-containing protein n=1 Tax=Luteimonas sp. MJ250 TaxID=3129236 RepID=UPI0031BAE8A9
MTVSDDSSRHGAVHDNDPATALVPASPRAQAWLFALVVILPLVLVGLTELSGSGSGEGQEALAVRAFASVAALCLVLWGALAALVRRHRLRLDAGGLEVATTFYRRRFDPDALDLARARVVDIDERPEFRAMLRTNGVSIPGFRSGWFRLRSGQRALVAASGGKRLLWIPTAAGHDLLLQPENPQALLDRLRAMAGSGGRR